MGIDRGWADKDVEMKLIYLEWADAISSGSTWIPKSELGGWINNSEWIIKQVGWILKETEEYILLTGQIKPDDYFTEEQYGHIQKIPKTWIRKRKTIEL